MIQTLLVSIYLKHAIIMLSMIKFFSFSVQDIFYFLIIIRNFLHSDQYKKLFSFGKFVFFFQASVSFLLMDDEVTCVDSYKKYLLAEIFINALFCA